MEFNTNMSEATTTNTEHFGCVYQCIFTMNSPDEVTAGHRFLLLFLLNVLLYVNIH